MSYVTLFLLNPRSFHSKEKQASNSEGRVISIPRKKCKLLTVGGMITSAASWRKLWFLSWGWIKEE